MKTLFMVFMLCISFSLASEEISLQEFYQEYSEFIRKQKCKMPAIGYAVEKGHDGIAMDLFLKDSDINSYDIPLILQQNNSPKRMNILESFLWQGKIETFEEFLKIYINVRHFDNYSSLSSLPSTNYNSILQWVIEYLPYDSLEQSVEKLLSFNLATTGYRCTGALTLAIEKKYDQIARILLEHGFDPNNEIYESPMHKAIKNDDEICVELLLQFGARVEKGMIEKAAEIGNTKILDLLVDAYYN